MPKAFDRIYCAVSKIPKGKVSTYKIISRLAKINNPRIVGFALHLNKNPIDIPCHRVIHSDGTLAIRYAFGGLKSQKEKLEKEGIVFLDKNKVDLKRSLL